MAVRIRRDVWKLNEWDETLIWYAKAIREMQRRPISDPASWRYQAAIHDYDGGAVRDPAESLPSATEQGQYWSQCQHFSWFFLPWHRLYLLYFEQIVAGTIAQLGGPGDWALPYWNYSDASNPNALQLPPAFIATALPDGSPNTLRVEDRLRGNDGAPVGDGRHVALTCLSERNFAADPKGGSPGFGGPKTRFSHVGPVVGALEAVPHGSMHVRVGGWMGAFSTAGLDPIFWLHHANIDRLWEVWRGRDLRHLDPVDPDWTRMRFDFHDVGGTNVSRAVADAGSLTALGYEYDDVADPFAAGTSGGAAARTRGPAVADQKDTFPEMVGATERAVRLTDRPTTARVAVTPPTGPARFTATSADGTHARLFLNVENVTGEGTPSTYSVYINVPHGASPRSREDLFAGILPLFGVREASRQTETHAGDGLHYSLDITELARRLQSDGTWDPTNLTVTFVPDETPQANAIVAQAADEGPVRFRVGRVSVYLA